MRNEDIPGDQIEWGNENGKIYNSIFTFKNNIPIEKRIAGLFIRRVICKEKECNRYEPLTQEFLEIHKLLYHGDQQFEDEHRTIQHNCRKENDKLKC